MTRIGLYLSVGLGLLVCGSSCRQADLRDADGPPDSSPAPQEVEGASLGRPLPVEAFDLRQEGPRHKEPQQEETEAEREFRDLLAKMGVRYFARERKLEISGWVNMQKGLVEVFACAPDGKTHESVVVLDCIPSGLHAGLLALGLEAGTPVELGTEGDYKPPTGDGVRIDVRWTGVDGQVRTSRAEDWVWNQPKEEAMAHCEWIFAGSFLQPVPGDPSGMSYAGNYVKSLVTTYHDASSVIECPFPEGVDDTIYYANERAVPEVGTPITAIFTPGRGSAGK